MNAADGVQAIKAQGGAVTAQSMHSAQHVGMPGSAIATGAVDYVVPIEAIPALLCRLTGMIKRAPSL